MDINELNSIEKTAVTARNAAAEARKRLITVDAEYQKLYQESLSCDLRLGRARDYFQMRSLCKEVLSGDLDNISISHANIILLSRLLSEYK